MGAYGDHDLQRYAPETSRVGRSDFQRDHARLIHSAAFRRLAAKTQVVVAGWDDFPRTRLTHSLECAQVGREMATSLGADPDVVQVACLAHDAGHPPFGHNGEMVLNELAASCGGFEGNAQSFRLLTRLEAKRFTREGHSVGLNLTRASLDAATKYPWVRDAAPAGMSPSKFGVYDEDLPIFTWMRQQTPAGQRCFEAQLMDWADDVAYSVHDVEDALFLGLLRLDKFDEPDFAQQVMQMAVSRFGAQTQQVEPALQRLVGLPEWQQALEAERHCTHQCTHASGVPGLSLHNADPHIRPVHACVVSTRPGAAAVKNLTSRLIGRFARSAEQATLQRYGPPPLVRYGAKLVIPHHQRAECDVLKAAAAVVMMVGPAAQRRYQQQQQVLSAVAQAFTQGRLRPPDPLTHADLNASSQGKLGEQEPHARAVVDAVASLTDTSILVLYQQLQQS